MNARAVPYHCPYCGDEDLRPHEVVADDGMVTSPHGTWECRACRRAFSLKMIGLLRPPRTDGPSPATSETEASP